MGVLAPGIVAPSEPIPSEARSVMVELTRWAQILGRPSWLLKGVVSGMFLLLCWLPLASADHGPPTPMFVDRMIGPYLVSVWGRPDVGTGTFFIRLEPLPEKKMSSDVTVHVGIQPLSGRLAETRHVAWRQEMYRYVQYQVEVPFDAQELWRVRIIIQGSDGSGEETIDIATTPPGLGRWDVLVYLLPFLAVGFLGLQVVLHRRNRNHRTRGQ
jgi:hypothetical protein